MTKIKNNTLTISIILLLIFYGVGLINVLNGNESIMRLSYVNLIISTLVLFANHKSWNTRIIFSLILVGLFGYTIEVIGVHTGVLFGEYTYGESLGFKVFEVPIVMGLNWIILCYIGLKFGVLLFKNNILSVLFASVVMTSLDFLIEPVAVRYDFWMWFKDGIETPNSIPVQNYIVWFIFAVLLNTILVSNIRKSENKLWPYLLITMTVFFVTLNFIL